MKNKNEPIPEQTQAASGVSLPVLVGGIAFVFVAIAVVALVAIQSDFEDSGVLYALGEFAVLALLLTWNPRGMKTAIARIALVVAVIGAVAYTVHYYRQIGEYRQVFNKRVATSYVRSVGESIENFLADGNKIPDNCDWKCMTQFMQDRAYWNSFVVMQDGTGIPFRFNIVPKFDGWGCRYVFEHDGAGNFMLRSSGRDRRFGTADDIEYISGETEKVVLPTLPMFPLEDSPVTYQ